MRSTAFGLLLSDFLVQHLAGQLNMSRNTIQSYRDTFVLLLRYCRDILKKAPERLVLEDFNAKLIAGFLDYLENERGCGASTRNQRLAAIHSFARYVQAEQPECFLECQRILLLPSKKRERKEIGYMNPDDLASVLAQPRLDSKSGRRDAVMLSLLYDTGARVQELIDLRVKDLRLDAPAQVKLTGKGRKVRSVPLMTPTVKILQPYLQENNLAGTDAGDRPVFQNRFGNPLSRSGIRYLLLKYVEQAREAGTLVHSRVTPHTLRHTKAMHLLQAGNPLVVIRNILGHSNVKTTEVYAQADMNMKRQALEKVACLSPTPDIPSWQTNRNLMDWLRQL